MTIRIGSNTIVRSLWRVAAVALCALGFAPGLAMAQTVFPTLVGEVSYNIDYGTGQATLRAETIANRSTTRTTGSLKLELWATVNPYSGGTINGTQMAAFRLPGNGQLSPNTSFTGVSLSGAVNAEPPPGSYYVTMILSEFASTCANFDQYCIVHHRNFSSPFYVAADEVEDDGGGGAIGFWLLGALASLGMARFGFAGRIRLRR